MTVTDPTGHVNQIGGGGGPVVTGAEVNADKAPAPTPLPSRRRI